MKVSVIICAFNPRMAALERVLAALRGQTLPLTDWELLLIDNASTEPLSQRVDLAWHPHARIVREDRLGVAIARARGFSESCGELVVMVDDDNVLDPGYLEQGLKIAAEWPQLGAWGGSCVPEFEVPPPEHLRPYLWLLALREVEEPRWTLQWSDQDAEPWGAGMCIRRRAALAYAEQQAHAPFRITGRTGNTFSTGSGEDTEICYVVCSLGLGMGIFPSLRLVHMIPRQRLDEQHLVRIAESVNISSMLLFLKWAGQRPASPFAPLALSRLVKGLLFRRGVDRRMAWATYHAKVVVRRIIAANPSSMPSRDRAPFRPPSAA